MKKRLSAPIIFVIVGFTFGAVGLYIATYHNSQCGSYGTFCIPRVFLGLVVITAGVFIGLPALIIAVKRQFIK